MLHNIKVRSIEAIEDYHPPVVINESQDIACWCDDTEVITLNHLHLHMPLTTRIEMVKRHLPFNHMLRGIKLWMHQTLKCSPLAQKITLPHLTFVCRLERFDKVWFEIKFICISITFIQFNDGRVCFTVHKQLVAEYLMVPPINIRLNQLVIGPVLTWVQSHH